MNNFSKVILALVGGVILFVWFAAGRTHYNGNIRLTLHAEIDGRPASASTVFQYDWEARFVPLEFKTREWLKIYGEALALDLGAHGVIFVPMFQPPGRTKAATDSYFVALKKAFTGDVRDREDEAFFRKLGALDKPLIISPDELTGFVRFATPALPQSIAALEPLAPAFSPAPGVRLMRADFERTDGPVSDTISSRLPWLRGYRDRRLYLSGETVRRIDGPIANRIDTGYFESRPE